MHLHFRAQMCIISVSNCGRVAERPIASVLKTEVPKGTGGSNPSSSVFFEQHLSFLKKGVLSKNIKAKQGHNMVVISI